MGTATVLMFLKAVGLIAFIFTVLLLAVSFFVLFVISKVQVRRLKVFGYIITVLLWICAAIVFSTVISVTLAKRNLNMPMMRKMRSQKQSMMQENPPAMMQEGQMREQGTR